jgi:DNA-binding MarR family transcriptional regulator
MAYEQLKLENQICFPIYVASRLITREYTPLLEKLGITYPQYLVLMALWETDGLTVQDITKRLFLNTNTVTPLLKRLEAQGLVHRQRSTEDERQVIVTLTSEGNALREQASTVPADLVESLRSDEITVEDLQVLVSQLNRIIGHLSQHSAADER